MMKFWFDESWGFCFWRCCLVVVQSLKIYDVLIVGFGIIGGWVVKEFIEKGFDVFVLEVGCNIVFQCDYVEYVLFWEVQFCGFKDYCKFVEQQFVQCFVGVCDEWVSKFFVNDFDNLYMMYFEGDEFCWICGWQVGGCFIMWGCQSYCWSDFDFEVNVKDGYGVDWLICYWDFVFWYDCVEEFVGICGQNEGLVQLFDGKFLLFIEMNCVEQEVCGWFDKVFGGM